MSIRYKFFLAFSILVALACFLAFVGLRGIATSGDLVVRLYDGPLVGINHTRSARATLNDARLLMRSGSPLDVEDDTRFEKLIADITDDLKVVRECIREPGILSALATAEDRVRDWSQARIKALKEQPDSGTAAPPSLTEKGNAAAALDDLVQIVAAYGLAYRTQAEASVAATRAAMLAIAGGTTLVGLFLAITFAYSMGKPISEATEVAERVASGNFTDQIASLRDDELGRLLRSLAAMQTRLKARADEDYAMMEKLDAALNNMSHGLCMFGPDNRLVLWNERYMQMYRIAPDRMYVGCPLDELLEAREMAGTAFREREEHDARLKAIKTGLPGSLIAELTDGRIVDITFQPTQNGGWVTTHEDITERKHDEARIAHLAFYDQLTGLPNRAALGEHISKTFHRASSGNENFAVLCLDLDGFKEINDVYGHSTGDRFLAEIGRRLALACEGSFIARQAGDEFTIVSSAGPQPAAAEELCERLFAVIDTPVRIDESEISASFTIGASVYPRDGTDPDSLIANAEAALCRAKAQERGMFQFFSPAMDQQIRDKRSLQQDIALALERNELELFFQPQATTRGEVFGFEVLVRWQHPGRGMVPPGLFIPLAEETGAIRSIDEWVLRTACREAASWPNPLSISVNLSPVDFRRGDIPATILSVLLETGLNPERLEIEITEGVLFEDFERAIAILRKIKNLGVRIAMDDFGTGYSSLSYLQSFPFDKIKIDQTFIAKIGKNFPAAAIIHSILGLGRALALPVIAEGVETEEQLAFLTNEGCDQVQGYLIGRPQPIAHYRQIVTKFAGGSNMMAIAG